ncbi:hypothetical protein ACROYT_G035390 [Oculina patagonica]
MKIALVLSIVVWMTCVADVTSLCPPGKRTDNEDGSCCVLPFEYKGKSYNSCTRTEHDKLWCALDAEYQRTRWANCVGECSADEAEGTNCVPDHGKCGKIEEDGSMEVRCFCEPGRTGERCQISEEERKILKGLARPASG